MTSGNRRAGFDGRKWRDGGIGTYIRALMRRLPGALPEIGSWVAFSRPRDADEIRALCPDWEIVELESPEYSIREIFETGRRARRARLDLLHSPHYMVPHDPNCPVVVTIHDAIQTDTRFFPFHQRIYARTMIRRALRKSVRAITVSESAKNEILSGIGETARRLTVIHNGVDSVAEGTREEALAHVRMRLGEPALGPALILAIGNHRAHKGLSTLISALRLVRRPEGFMLFLVGSQISSSEWERFLAAIPEHWREHTRRSPPVSPDLMPSIYQAASMFISPSNAEGFGLPILEAMAAGTPVIASDIPPHREIGGKIPFYFPPGSPSALAQLLERLFSGRIDFGPHRVAGVVHARGFSWDRTVEATADAYRSILTA